MFDFAVSPTDPEHLLATTTEGIVQHSADGGATWETRGDVGGQPEALLVDESGGELMLYVGVSGRRILASADGGQIFSTRYAD